jgi:hypothetical protein
VNQGEKAEPISENVEDIEIALTEIQKGLNSKTNYGRKSKPLPWYIDSGAMHHITADATKLNAVT